MERRGLHVGLCVGSFTEESTRLLRYDVVWLEKTGLSKSHPVSVLVVNTCPSVRDHVGSGTAGVGQMVYCLQLTLCFPDHLQRELRTGVQLQWPLAMDTTGNED